MDDHLLQSLICNFTSKNSASPDHPTCLPEMLSCVSHVYVTLVAMVTGITYCCREKSTHVAPWSHYSGHTLRWLLSLLLLLSYMCAIGAGAISASDSERPWPYLYVPSILGLVATFLTISLYNAWETGNCRVPLLSLLVYWAGVGGLQGWKVWRMVHAGYAKDLYVRFYVTIVVAAAYVLLLVIELYLLLSKRYCCGSCCAVPPSLPPSDLQDREMTFYQPFVNPVSMVTYWWLNGFLSLGYKRPLEMSDLGKLPKEHHAAVNHKLLGQAFNEHMTKWTSAHPARSLWASFVTVYGWRFFLGCLFQFVGSLLAFVGPFCIDRVVQYVELSHQPQSNTTIPQGVSLVTFDTFARNGFVLTVVLLVALVTKACCLHMANYIVMREGISAKTGLQAMVYEKTLRLSSAALTGVTMTTGEVINHLSIDAGNIMDFFLYIFYLWSAPITLVVAMVMLYLSLGEAALAGAGLMILLAPVQWYLAMKMGRLQKETLEQTDQRIKKSNEMLQAMKLIKLYAWEDIFSDMIKGARKKELGVLLKGFLYGVCVLFITRGTPILTTLLTFGLYTLIADEPLTAGKAFSSLALFNILEVPLMVLPMVTRVTVNAVVSNRRLGKFFVAPEVDGTDQELRGESLPTSSEMDLVNAFHPSEDQRSPLVINASQLGSETFELNDNTAIQVEDGSFAWDLESKQPILTDLYISIPQGKLTFIVGSVGSGKSSLLNALLGEMTTITGSVRFSSAHNCVAFAAQKPWLLNASLKDNILFGSPMDRGRYSAVISACALQPDLDILPAGEETEIGEKGINLSGGQKQRVSVARALYSTADIVILDDPLSALDVHVGTQLFEEGIVGLLAAEGRTVILVTHKLQLLPEADLILVMKDGQVAIQGTLEEISQASPHLFEQWKEEWDEQEEEEEEEDVKNDEKKDKKEEDEKERKDGKLMTQEEREKGIVEVKVYLTYAYAGGIVLVIVAMLAQVALRGFAVARDFWLSDWSSAASGHNGSQLETSYTSMFVGIEHPGVTDVEYYLIGYAILSGGVILTTLIGALLFLFVSYRAAKNLHRAMLDNIVRAPMRFFDTTPLGRIINRFSSDTQTIDQKLQTSILTVVSTTLQCLAAVVVNAIVTPWFLIPALPVIGFYFFMQNYFRASSRELQRLENISKSPVLASFTEVLGGLSTVRSYKEQGRFSQQFQQNLDSTAKTFMWLNTANRWLGVRLDLIGSVIVFAAALSSLLAAVLGHLAPGLVGLSLTYALSVSGYLTWLVRSLANVEMKMNSLERVKHYTEVQTEPQEGTTVTPVDLPANWPSRGEVRVSELSTRYAADLEPVLMNVSVLFKGGEKVGICGRTGSGKSSLTLSLFRMIDNFAGKIYIDDVDISKIGLQALRSKLSIIPQDPVLFAGTIRFNLDPMDSRSDQELWDALAAAQLKGVVSDLPEGLDSVVSEGGENFSVGQRQLFCLARAFLRKTKILIMDEATASLDLETDSVLQTAVTTAFADRTVITIAHRLSTILDYDHILVLKDGRVVENGPPQELLCDTNSLFSALVRGS
ncbi:ATP-binding cassette sub-family C member 9-like [Branchiostoma lanceolatum]|uniref:ATP-binding cassette sub-family C member 9-like n=1 Tax=Branchiostoma lanceolatum TaxID=7740 RepID=UPI00345206EE